MQNFKNRIHELSNAYDVQLEFANNGCLIFYKNTMETDLIEYNQYIDKKYLLNNFELVVDSIKLQDNLYQFI